MFLFLIQSKYKKVTEKQWTTFKGTLKQESII